MASNLPPGCTDKDIDDAAPNSDMPFSGSMEDKDMLECDCCGEVRHQDEMTRIKPEDRGTYCFHFKDGHKEEITCDCVWLCPDCRPYVCDICQKTVPGHEIHHIMPGPNTNAPCETYACDKCANYDPFGDTSE